MLFEFAFLIFGPELELEDVRVIVAQMPMFATRRVAALLECCSVAVVEVAQEGHRAGGHAAGRASRGVLGPQTGKGESQSRPPELVDHGGEFNGRRKFLRWSRRRGAQAGRKLPSSEPGFISGWRIGQEAQSFTCRRRPGQRVGFPRGLFYLATSAATEDATARKARSRPRRNAVLVLAVKALGRTFTALD